jgi:hypothetical protein
MAIPVQPTKTTIATEAIKRFLNGSTPEAAHVSRAEDYGLEKVKRDLMNLGKTWWPLIRTDYEVTVVGVSHYSNPSDFEKHISIGYMTGEHTDVLTNVVGPSTMTLHGAEDATKAEAEGKWLLITAGTGAKQAEQIDNYNTGSKIVNLRSSLATTPAVGDTYLIVNSIVPLIRWDLRLYNKMQYISQAGTPVRYAEIEDQTTGLIALNPVPSSIAGLKRVYYVDLMEMDMALDLYDTILRRWANVFEQGIYVWKLEEDDNRYVVEKAVYDEMLMKLCIHDLDGFVLPEAK